MSYFDLVALLPVLILVLGSTLLLIRITSYNVCYTKLLRSSAFDVVRDEPHIIVSATDAGRLNIGEGDTVVMLTALGKMHIRVKIDERAIAGVVLLPYFDRAGTGAFVPGTGTFDCRLLKEDQ